MNKSGKKRVGTELKMMKAASIRTDKERNGVGLYTFKRERKREKEGEKEMKWKVAGDERKKNLREQRNIIKQAFGGRVQEIKFLSAAWIYGRVARKTPLGSSFISHDRNEIKKNCRGG